MSPQKSFGPFGGDELCALRASTVQKDDVEIPGPDLVELAPDQAARERFDGCCALVFLIPKSSSQCHPTDIV